MKYSVNFLYISSSQLIVNMSGSQFNIMRYNMLQIFTIGFVSLVNSPLVKTAKEDKLLFDTKPYQQSLFSYSRSTRKILILELQIHMAVKSHIFYSDFRPI